MKRTRTSGNAVTISREVGIWTTHLRWLEIPTGKVEKWQDAFGGSGDAEVVENRREIWVHAHLGPGWHVAGQFVDKEGAIVLAEVRVYPYEPPEVRVAADAPNEPLYLDRYDTGEWSGDPAAVPPGGLTTTFLREAFPLEEMYAAARRIPRDPDTDLIEQWAPRSGLSNASTKSGPDGQDDAFYAEWAARYVKACAIGARRIYQTLRSDAQARGEYVEESTIKGYIQEARHRRLLTTLGQGRSGGELTARGRDALRAAGVDPERISLARARDERHDGTL